MGKIMPDKLPLPVQWQVEDGISILKQGGIVAFPTDTVYGLGAGASVRSAVERIYEVKKRPRNMALPLLLADTAQISEFAEPVPSVAWLLASAFLPGALTMILTASTAVADFITAGGSTVALRIPSHPVPLALIKGLKVPVVGTSANLSGKPSPLTADEVYAQFGGSIDLVIDGGRCPGGVESTIVDLSGDTPVVVREGAISREELRQVCAVI
jgi:L-threonylcarbamoyladenylate synthase